MLLKAGIGGPLDAVGSLERFTGAFNFDTTLKRVFGPDRVGFYRVMLESVEDYKRFKVLEAKLVVKKAKAKARKDELAGMVAKIREQMAILNTDKTRTTLAAIKDNTTKKDNLTALINDVNSMAVETLSMNNFKAQSNKRGENKANERADSMTNLLSTPATRELIKRYMKGERTKSEVLTDIQVDLDKLTGATGDITAVSEAVKGAVATIQSYLSAVLHLIKAPEEGGQSAAIDAALSGTLDASAENPIAIDSTGEALEWNAFFESVNTGLTTFATESAIIGIVVDPPSSSMSTTPILNDMMNKYKRNIDLILRHLTLTTPGQIDAAIKKAERETKEKNPFSFGEGISAAQVYRIYNAHKWDRERKKNLMNQLAFDLAQLVRYMEYARDDYNRAADRAGDDLPEGERDEKLRAARKEFEFECNRIQRKINTEMKDYPEVREMYLKICSPMQAEKKTS